MMSYNTPPRIDRTRIRAGEPDYTLLGNVLSSANMFRRDKKLGVIDQLEESKIYNEKLLENLRNTYQGVRERVTMMASKESRCEADDAAVAKATDTDKNDHDPQVPQSPPPDEIPTQSSGYMSQESPNSSPDPKCSRRLDFSQVL